MADWSHQLRLGSKPQLTGSKIQNLRAWEFKIAEAIRWRSSEMSREVN